MSVTAVNDNINLELHPHLIYAMSEEQQGEFVSDVMRDVLSDLHYYAEVNGGYAEINEEVFLHIKAGRAVLTLDDTGVKFGEVYALMHNPLDSPEMNTKLYLQFVQFDRFHADGSHQTVSDYLPGCQYSSETSYLVNSEPFGLDLDFEQIFGEDEPNWDDYVDRYAEAYQSQLKPLIMSYLIG